MGGGNHDPNVYAARSAYHKSTGTSMFTHTTAVNSGTAPALHPELDPAKLNTFDAKVRECFDSDDHPNTTPIAVMFDVTGSMTNIPMLLVEKLQNLFGLLLRKGYCEDPQVLVGGIGDAISDRVPLQVSQFEADNRIDENLASIYLEGNGGGGGRESYALAFHFLGNYVKLDSLDKRGKKGYLFVIGDEMCHDPVMPNEISKFIGDDATEPVSLAEALAKVQETFDVYWIYPAEAHYYGDPRYVQFWKDALPPEHVIVVDDINNVCETIGTAIGLLEGAVDMDDALDNLDEIDASGAKGTVSKALANVGAGAGGGAVAVAETPTGLDSDSGTSRL